MSEALLGASFDIHGGGIDLVFPHHENEIAQSVCAHPEGEFARYWMHNGFLNVEGEKMSKSLGNFFTVRDLLDRGIPGEVIRFVLLSTHYRQPMDFTDAKIEEALAILRRWRAFAGGIEPSGGPDQTVVGALMDDLNTPQALAELHRLHKTGGAHEFRGGAALLGLLTPALGAWFSGTHDPEADELVSYLVKLRNEARHQRDFATADQLRSDLLEAGVRIMDRPGEESSWEFAPDFDLSKLKGMVA
jgi:cysteinyl-tRNA synthetase